MIKQVITDVSNTIEAVAKQEKQILEDARKKGLISEED